jgi:hypothetical protein
VDKWLQEAGIDAELAARQFQRRAKPAEPQDCPHHSTVERAFLNPICEDCLQAELNQKAAAATELSLEAFPLPPSRIVPENGEGLIWDSEVRVEIQSQTSHDHASPLASNAIECVDDQPVDVDRRILESHIEIKVEVDSYSVSADDPSSSPLFTSSRDGRSSRSSSIATSPESVRVEDKLRFPSDRPKTKRYGLTFHDTISSNFGDVGDDIDTEPHGESHSAPLQLRGRSPTRRDADDRQPSIFDLRSPSATAENSSGKKGLPRFKSIRSISSSFRHGPKQKDHIPPLDNNHRPASNATSAPRSSSGKQILRNPFRVFRTRKASRDIVETIESTRLMTHEDDNSHNMEGSMASCTDANKPSRPLPPREDSLGDWTSLSSRDHQDPVESSLRNRSRSLAPSPTGSLSQNQLDCNDERSLPVMEVPVHATTSFDTRSVFSEFEAEGAPDAMADLSIENTPPSTMDIPNTPKSFNISSLRARIEGLEEFDLGLDDTLTAGQMRPPGQTGDVQDQAKGPSLLEPEQIISMYGVPGDEETTGNQTTEEELASHQLEAPEQNDHEEEQPLSQIGPTEATEAKIANLVLEESGQVAATKTASPCEKEEKRDPRPAHPPRKSSLKRLTRYNHMDSPATDCDVPVPALVLPYQEV